jgi:hypothetical protein
MPTTSQRIAAIAVLALSVLIVGYLALRAFGVPIGVAASPSPSPVATATVTSTEPAPPASGSPAEDDLAAAVAEIEAQVRETRQLPDPQIGPPELLTRDELAAELDASFAEDYPPDEREADNIVLRALGLLDAGQDVGELQKDLLTSQVLGFYDDQARRMVIVSDAGLDALGRITYAHEYTHALQDKAFGLAGLELEAEGQDDRSLGRLALVEGDATVTMFLWALQFAPEVMAEIQETPIPDTGEAPQWMVDSLSFPYVAGATFVFQLWTTADPGAVDAVYAQPPASTEQILHYDKYVAGEVPIEVPELDLAGALGARWSAVESTSIGEAQIGIFLRFLGASDQVAAAASSGWGGDRLTAARDGDDVALAWRLAWDRPADATEFAAAWTRVVDDGAIPIPARVEQLSDTEVLVVHGSTQAIVDAAVAAAR